jgi:hypothetical protein
VETGRILTFGEAFANYEQGNTVISLVTQNRYYRKNGEKPSYFFSEHEIRGDWMLVDNKAEVPWITLVEDKVHPATISGRVVDIEAVEYISEVEGITEYFESYEDALRDYVKRLSRFYLQHQK